MSYVNIEFTVHSEYLYVQMYVTMKDRNPLKFGIGAVQIIHFDRLVKVKIRGR